MSCVYCDLPEIQAREIARNDLARVLPTNIPITPGHLLVMPLRCVTTFSELTGEERAAIFDLTARARDALIKEYGAEGFNYAWNEGGDFGQTVPHFHIHIVPRTTGDTGITKYEPREFLYRPGSREKTPEDELQAVAKAMRVYF